MKSFRERLGNEWLFWDGGTGTQLQKMGLGAGELPELWNTAYPERIVSLHRSYLDAGCHIINTNTFGANSLKFPEDLEDIVNAAVKNAFTAREESGRDDVYIALDIGPTGRLIAPMGDLYFEDAVEIFAQVIRTGSRAGADLILIETMTDSYEARAAVIAAKENCDLPICVTATFDKGGKLLTGGSPESFCVMMEALGVDAIGLNCGLGPVQMLPLAERLTESCSIPVIVSPNAGLPRQEKGKTVYDLDADSFSDHMREIAKAGVHVLGGCCGTDPEFIEKLIKNCIDIPFQKPIMKEGSFISSFSQTLKIGEKTLIIGERINPTGKKRLAQALRDRDFDYIMNEALKQEDNGADILDVNVGLPDIDEGEIMAETVTRLQSICSLPLQIDAAGSEVIERGLRLYNGKALINSVNGKKESMEAIFPLAKKYGAVVVALCLDETGIPATAQGRIDIAKKIIDVAAGYGIEKKDIMIDGLCMTVSSDPGSALVCLETISRVKKELGLNTILGVSNISFGLPLRSLINSHFLSMAISSGLSCAIMDPGNEDMKRSYRASLALCNMDPNCMEYIESCQEREKAVPAPVTELSLGECIEHGLSDKACIAASAAAGREMELINEELIPALDRVGRAFEEGRVFLPQLLMSAEAAKAAFETMKPALAGEKKQIKGKVILATVKNDIHDIGKNIVKVMLENYSYEVIDLGRDVAPEVIVDAAIEHDVRLVGLSALMTTTVSSMEETIRILKEKKAGTKVVVGGAVMTQDYADSIGADHYAKDAMATVRYADTVFL